MSSLPKTVLGRINNRMTKIGRQYFYKKLSKYGNRILVI